MTEYSAEEVRAMASDLRGAPGTSMIGTHISLPTAMAVAIYEALCAYAERIKADEGVAPVGEVFGPKALSTAVALTNPLPPGTKLFAHPPAQAAQVDAMPEIRAWLADYADELDEQGSTDVATTIRATVASLTAAPTAKSVAQGEFDAEARSHARMIHDFPRLSAFFQKHALGSKLPVSCFACGHVGESAITHAELADVYVCKTCAERITKSSAQSSDPLAQPTTNSPETDSKLVGGAVAQVRHFDYRGVTGHGFSQEAQMLDGAPVLPDGTLLYTTPPAQPRAVPDGMVLVPREPTETMLYAWLNHDSTRVLRLNDDLREAARADWAAMLAAAQEADRAEPCNRNCDCVGPCKMGADR